MKTGLTQIQIDARVDQLNQTVKDLAEDFGLPTVQHLIGQSLGSVCEPVLNVHGEGIRQVFKMKDKMLQVAVLHLDDSEGPALEVFPLCTTDYEVMVSLRGMGTIICNLQNRSLRGESNQIRLMLCYMCGTLIQAGISKDLVTNEYATSQICDIAISYLREEDKKRQEAKKKADATAKLDYNDLCDAVGVNPEEENVDG